MSFAFSAFDIGKGSGETPPDSTDTEPSDSTDTSGAEDPVIPDGYWDTVKGESFNALLVGTDYQPSFYNDYDPSVTNELDENGFPKEPRAVEADAIILVRVNKNTGEVIYTAIPANTSVTIDGAPALLEELYAEKGIASLCEKVQSLTGLPIDFYAVVSIDSFERIIDELGGITYHVDRDMQYIDEEKGLYIDLKAGTQKLDGKKALDMLRYNGYSDGDISRRECAVKFIKALAKKLTEKENYENAFILFNKYSEYIETNFTTEELGTYVDLIFSYSKMTEKSYTYPGTTTGVGDDAIFTPNAQKAIQFFSAYRFNG